MAVSAFIVTGQRRAFFEIWRYYFVLFHQWMNANKKPAGELLVFGGAVYLEVEWRPAGGQNFTPDDYGGATSTVEYQKKPAKAIMARPPVCRQWGGGGLAARMLVTRARAIVTGR
jgi:hypothetical protein